MNAEWVTLNPDAPAQMDRLVLAAAYEKITAECPGMLHVIDGLLADGITPNEIGAQLERDGVDEMTCVWVHRAAEYIALRRERS